MLAQLRTLGNRIADASTLAPVLLRGVCRSGLEYSGPDATICADEIDVIVNGWGANIIRLPFNQEWALNSEPYRRSIDEVIEAAACRGAYTLLDLQWIDTTVRIAPLPNTASGDLWTLLARRYAGHPAVLYDIYNEPHDVTMREWQPWAVYLVNAIRSENPDALIFISGVDWGYDLKGFPLPEVENVVYSTHIYRNKGDYTTAAFGPLSERDPVFAGEWGAFPGEELWGAGVVDYLAARNIGWTAWSWCDNPRIIETPGAPDYRPTAYGQLVKDRLSQSV